MYAFLSGQSFGSQSWDVALSIQAILATNLHHEFSDTLKKGHDFIKKSQVRSVMIMNMCVTN